MVLCYINIINNFNFHNFMYDINTILFELFFKIIYKFFVYNERKSTFQATEMLKDLKNLDLA